MEAPKSADDIVAKTEPAYRFVHESTAVPVSFSMREDAPVASTSYIGLLDEREVGEERTWGLNELIGAEATEKFTLVEAKPGCISI